MGAAISEVKFCTYSDTVSLDCVKHCWLYKVRIIKSFIRRVYYNSELYVNDSISGGSQLHPRRIFLKYEGSRLSEVKFRTYSDIVSLDCVKHCWLYKVRL